ncbi:hypothetical protein PHET_04547 [Paragonimus heterotremus]|uniref:Uncharacterized protein n=1 Tax=Paragonimus heterotremus TaxID=100268 RepID=A0A8J4SQE7_9TREM|nr:hypothetical protein PHET_04547 [Paragonimus heterotremus]
MPLPIQGLLAENFQKLTNSLQPYETGGVLNFLFEPVTNVNTSEVLLKLGILHGTTIKNFMVKVLFEQNPIYQVLSVLPQEVRPMETGGSHYLGFVVTGIVVIVITLALMITTLIIPCKSQRSGSRPLQKKTEKPSQAKNCYLALGITTLVLLMFAMFCFVFTYLAFDLTVIDADQSSNPATLQQTVTFVFNQTKQILQDLPDQGLRVTNLTISSVESSVNKELSILVPNIMEELLVSYKARGLLDLVKQLSITVGWLGNTTRYVTDEQTKVLDDIQRFQGKMSGYQTILQKALNKFCPNLTDPEKATCTNVTNRLSLLNVDFNASEILTEPSIALSGLTELFGLNMTQLIQQFDKLENDLRERANAISSKIQKELNLQTQFQSLLSIWNTVKVNVTQPVINQLNALQPTVESSTGNAVTLVLGIGHSLWTVFALCFVVLIVYLALNATEAKERQLIALEASDQPADGQIGNPMMLEDSNNPNDHLIFPKSRNHITLGQCLPLIAVITFPILVLLGVLGISFVSLLNNEGCSYLERNSGIRITDAALNLYLKYLWPSLITKQNNSSKILDLLTLPVPQNVYSALRFRCQRAENSTTSPGLLPTLGLSNIINVTAVLNQPELLKVIKDNENNLVNEILKINFSRIIPANVDELLKTVSNITGYLDNSNYSTTIAALNKPIINVSNVLEYMKQIRQLVNPFVNTSNEAILIRDTTDDVELTLSNVTQLNENVKRLANAFDTLQKFQNLTKQLENLNTTLLIVVKILTNRTQVEQPIRPIYQANIRRLLQNLTGQLEQLMTQFTSNVISCDRLNMVLMTVLNVTCGSNGQPNRLGTFTFMLLLLICPLLLAVLLFQLFLWQHQYLCLCIVNQGIPFYLFTKYVEQDET